MYNLNRRECFTTLGELRLLLAAFSPDTRVHICDADIAYLHVDEAKEFVALDTSALDEDYFEWYPVDDSHWLDFWHGQDALMMEEHRDRLQYLSYMGKETTLPF